MRIIGRIFKEKKGDDLYCVHSPAIGMWTQGESIDDSVYMASDWLQTAYPDLEFTIELTNKKTGVFTIECTDKLFVAIILKQAREDSGLSLDQVSKKLGFASKNAIYAYETGAREPTISKFQELLGAYGVKLDCQFSQFSKVA